MTIKVTGKNLDLGESLRSYTLDRLESVVGKYADQSISGQVSIEKYNAGYITHCAIHLSTGIDTQSSGQSHDPYGSVDAALERLEKRLRRYRRRLKSHGQPHPGSALHGDESAGVDYTLDAEHVGASETDLSPDEGAPAIIAEISAGVKALSVSDAVMQMDLADQEFLVFRNAAHGGVNVVYRRPDGHIGWIDPSVNLGTK